MLFIEKFSVAIRWSLCNWGMGDEKLILVAQILRHVVSKKEP